MATGSEPLEEAKRGLAALAAGPRILTLDIETSPNVVYTWGLFKQTVGINQVIETGRVLCFAAKWFGDKRIEFRSDFHDGHDEMVRAVHALLDEADIVVGWNSRAFDVKHIQREMLLAGLPPVSPHRDVDLLLVARKRFKFTSNKLDHVAAQLGVGSKVKHHGFEMWAECLAGDPKAWALMKRYNIGDVALTEAVYERLLPWIDNHPHQGLYGGPRAGCPRCGSMLIEQDGYVPLQTGRYALWRCQACTGTFRGTHRVEAVHHRTT
jgi:DNA polymerase elongation subunit (family B)